MNAPSTAIERVIKLLSSSGYRNLGTRLDAASVPFTFACVLIGPERSPDLIVIVDTIEEEEDLYSRKLQGLSRALDVAGSRRSLSAVLVGPAATASTLEVIGRVCRVLQVTGTGAAQNSLEDDLAVLLPLKLPELTDSAANTIAELDSHLPPKLDKALLHAFLDAAPSGSTAVEAELQRLLAEPYYKLNMDADP